jgi:hypothetical protein
MQIAPKNHEDSSSCWRGKEVRSYRANFVFMIYSGWSLDRACIAALELRLPTGTINKVKVDFKC